MSKVSFERPEYEIANRIAIIGDSPTKDDILHNRPFSEGLGRLLGGVMHSAGIQRSACLLGYSCQFFGRFSEASYQRKESLEELKHEIDDYDPNIVVCMGEQTLRLAGIYHKLHEYRGSLFICTKADGPFFLRKCIGIMPPMEAIKVSRNLPLMAFDLKRAYEESTFKELTLPDRHFDIGSPASTIIGKLQGIRMGTNVAFDIEGGGEHNISMLSFATSPYEVFHITPAIYTPTEWQRVFGALKQLLENPRIGLIAQNSLYEMGCLFFQWKINLQGPIYDTMMSGWELYPELPKNLGLQTSIQTREPYYKSDRTNPDVNVHNNYNCKDSAVTMEIYLAHEEQLTDQAKEHYTFNCDLLKPTLYMMMKGWNYDQIKADERGIMLATQQKELMAGVETQAGCPLNINSPKQMNEVLYHHMGFEKQYKKEKGRKTTKLTCDVDALLKLHKDTQHPIIGLILKWRNLDGIRKQLLVTTDEDKRVRCNYNITGTDTGRYSCNTHNSGSGTNLTTITKKNRDLYCADEGYDFFQCDLEGADGWTVAAWCDFFGYSSMLSDYQNDTLVKPAKCIAAMYLDERDNGGSLNLSQMPSDEMSDHLKTIKLEEWLYFAAKRVQHGTNYGLKPNTMSNILLKDSYKIYGAPIYVSVADCRRLQDLYISRYPGVLAWQNRVEREIKHSRSLGCASGHIRKFFGNKHDFTTIKAALAHEPQANTAYATNMALWRMWYDGRNRRPNGRLIVSPLHQVHDALCGQWLKADREQAIPIVRECFSNNITIAEHSFIIPFEGQWGPNWLDMPNMF